MKGLLLLISLSVMVTTAGFIWYFSSITFDDLVVKWRPFDPLLGNVYLTQLDAGGLEIGETRILRLRAETPLFMLDMRGRIKPQGDYPLDLKTEWSVKYPGYAPIIGRGELTGTLKEIKVVQDVIAPFYARLNATVTDVLTMPKWEVSLALKGFNPQEINPVSPAVEINGKIEGRGGYKDNRWYGEIKQADLISPSLGRGVLEKSGRFTISLEQAQTDQWCWVNDITKVCLQTGWRKGVGSHGTAVISHLPLSIMKSMVPPGITVEGILDASVTVLYSNKKVLTGEASLKTSMGSISYAISEGKEVILKFKEGIINSVLTEDSLNVKLELPLVDNGFINGWITLPPFSSVKLHREQQIIKGNINTEIRELGLIPVVFPEVEDTHGVFKGDITIAGTLADPYIMGKLRLDQGTTDVPRLGIRLEDINIDAVSDGKGIIEVNGKGRSGQGMVEVNGAINLKTYEFIDV
jgi:autotransporter translocation and assembly factor TamB